MNVATGHFQFFTSLLNWGGVKFTVHIPANQLDIGENVYIYGFSVELDNHQFPLHIPKLQLAARDRRQFEGTSNRSITISFRVNLVLC